MRPTLVDPGSIVAPTLEFAVADEVRQSVRSLNDQGKFLRRKIAESAEFSGERARWRIELAVTERVLQELLEITWRARRTTQETRRGMPETPLDSA